MKLSVIILARTTTDELFKMTCNCVNSLLASENNIEMEIIIVESNKDFLQSDYKYLDCVSIIIPKLNFNFHKFLNIGIKASTGDFIALCNNDLIFYKNWFSEILKVKEHYPAIKSFSPNGILTDHPFTKSHVLGYKVRTHIMGWCIVATKDVFHRIKYLDETFDFNYADNDYAMTLKRLNIKHAVVNMSKVIHLAKNERNEKKFNVGRTYKDLQSKVNLNVNDLPDYIFLDDYKFLHCDNKSLEDNIKFHKKWGNPKIYYRRNKIADFLIKYNLGILNRYILLKNI